MPVSATFDDFILVMVDIPPCIVIWNSTMNWSPVVQVTLSLILNGSSPIVDSMLFDYHMLVLGFQVIAISDKMYACNDLLCLH